jgi:PEP-CTERM motif
MNITRTNRTAALRLCLISAAIAICTVTQAATIQLFNTGVDNFGNALAANVNDPHYDLTIPTVNTEVTVVDTAFPIPPWVANNANSRWIGPTSNGTAASGNYNYRTTFSLPANANLSTASISGQWSTDDSAIDIFINGNPTFNTTSGHAGLWPFSINSGFQFGLNTLDFTLNNSIFAGSFSPTGLRVDKIVGTYQLIPEPATVCLMAIALFGSWGAIRRRRAAFLTTG